MNTKTQQIKCMAKGCNIIIEITLKRVWYLENNKRVYYWAKKNELSFCNDHTQQFNKALQEMKEVQTKESINKDLKETIQNNVDKGMKKYD